MNTAEKIESENPDPRNPSADFVRECLDYSPETGIFVWKHRPASHFAGVKGMNIVNAKRAGKSPQNLSKAGYLRIGISGKVYWGHRLAWLITHGSWPEGVIDHINGNRSDNRIANLRDASVSQNQFNRRKGTTNTSGFKGIHLFKQTGKYMAYVDKNGKRFNLGSFSRVEDAAAAVKAARESHHGEFCNHG